MRISEMLLAIANWLESKDNEAILLSEYDDKCLQIVATSCVEAAHSLRKAASKVDEIEPPSESNITSENISKLAEIANAFDLSNDKELMNQASLIDELILKIATPKEDVEEAARKRADDFDSTEKNYVDPKKILDKSNKVEKSLKDIDRSGYTKKVDILQEPLSTRYCPDHPGVQIARVGDREYQCSLDKKVYNFDTGYTLENGTQVPGGSVSEQSRLDTPNYSSMFDSRQGRLQTNKP